jgi:hypothetical protein
MTVQEDEGKADIADRWDSMVILELVLLQFAVDRYLVRGPDDGFVVGCVTKLDLQTG